VGEHHIPRELGEKYKSRAGKSAARYLHVSKELRIRPDPLFPGKFQYYLEHGDGKTYRRPKSAGNKG
jgi:hypothetical protein